MADNADNGILKPEDEKTKVVDSNSPTSLSGSGQGAVGGQRLSSYSSGMQPGQQGSGRFTNLSKYIGTNEGAGAQIGARIGDSFSSKLDRQSKDIEDKNKTIASNIGSGNDVIEKEGSVFKQELGDIGQGLNKFNSMVDRSGFDDASQKAEGFATSPKFSRFQTIQSGQGIDDNSLKTGQAAALASGNELNKFTQDRLNKINTEKGRYDLMRDTYGNKQNYSSGNARFDQLFLQNSPSNVVGNLSNKFNQGNLTAAQKLQTINKQGTDINDLLSKESGLITDLNKQAKSNQDLFNEKLGNQKNIDYIQSLRDAKYNEYLNQLKSGNISNQVAGDLGLNDLYTYEPGGLGVNPNRISAKMSVGDITGAQQTNPERALRMYNTDLANTAGSYLQRGKIASKMQDITTQKDYDAYKALQAISGLDTGKLTGISNLNPAVKGKKSESEGLTLAEKIANQDKAFRDTYAGKAVQSMNKTVESGPGGNNFDITGATAGNNSVTRDDIILNNMTLDDAVANFNNRLSGYRSTDSSNLGSGQLGSAYANIDEYIKNSNIKQLGGSRNNNIIFDNNSNTTSNQAAFDNANATARADLSNYLNNMINQTGVKNTGTIGLDDTNNEVLKNARRFSGLV